VFNDLVKKFGEKIGFSFIYIQEAHAQDAWPISSGRFNCGRGPVIVNTPQNTAQRVLLAGRLLTDFQVHEDVNLFVDSIEGGDQFLEKFAPWPIRLYLLRCTDGEPVVDFIFEIEHGTIRFDILYNKLSEVNARL
jgi:hypothetical protein